MSHRMWCLLAHVRQRLKHNSVRENTYNKIEGPLQYLCELNQDSQSVMVRLCIIMCALKSPRSVNCFSHMSQMCGIFPVCAIRCFVRFPAPINCISQRWQLCSFFARCVFICCLQLDEVENAFSQMSQLCGFSPVWVSTWLVN